MRRSGNVFWVLSLVLVLGIVFADTPLLAKGKDKGRGGGQEKKERKEKKAKVEKEHKVKMVAPKRRARIYSPPVAGSIQKDVRKYRYVYYPDVTTYYNRDTGQYFWLQDGNWVSGHSMPEWGRVRNLPRIELEEYYLTPYADHSWVTQTFPTGPEVTGISRQPWKGNGPPAHAPAWGYRRKYNYQYYPQPNVYYNVDTKRYFWIEGGGWRVGIELPSGINLDGAEKTSMVLGSPFPY